jgi:hypothetical protein
MRVMAVCACGVTVVVEEHNWSSASGRLEALRRVMRIKSDRKRMPDLVDLGVDVESYWSQI